MDEPKLKKIVFNDTQYMATSRDGIIFGDRTANGAHTTMLFKENRLTVHHTASGQHVNLFGADTKEMTQEFAAAMEEFVYSTLSKKAPTHIYPIAINRIFEFTVRGRIAYCKVASSSDYILPRVDFESFMDSEFCWGLSRNDEWLIKGRLGLHVIAMQDLKRLGKRLEKLAFFKALEIGINRI
ncbi:MAG: hypothetical protein WCY41_03460 [Candidatus Micrarchaeia archaeon]